MSTGGKSIQTEKRSVFLIAQEVGWVYRGDDSQKVGGVLLEVNKVV